MTVACKLKIMKYEEQVKREKHVRILDNCSWNIKQVNSGTMVTYVTEK